MAAFLRAALGPGVDEDRVDVYCDGSVEHFGWLVSIGVPFRAAFCPEPNRESADDAGLLFSGGEDAYPFDELSPPVPRGHKPRYVDSAGGFLMECLATAVATSGARVVCDARAEALVVDGRGRRRRRGPNRRRAALCPCPRRSDPRRWWFISNDDMVAEYCPLAHAPDPAWRIGTPADDGRGIRMGVGAGAVATRLDRFECALPLGPPHALARGILVNRLGERFINEDAYTGRIGLHALHDHGGFIYMITDDVIHAPNAIGLRIGYAAATPEELAVELGLCRELARTVHEYNQNAARGLDPTFHKRAPYLQPIGVAPASGIGAIDLRLDHGAIYATFTLGGLVTDPDGAASTAAVIASLVSTPGAGPRPAWPPSTTRVASASATARSSGDGPVDTREPGSFGARLSPTSGGAGHAPSALSATLVRQVRPRTLGTRLRKSGSSAARGGRRR